MHFGFDDAGLRLVAMVRVHEGSRLATRPDGVNYMYEIFCSISRASAKRVAVVWTVRARLVLDTIDARHADIES